jgi:hypothetical protein
MFAGGGGITENKGLFQVFGDSRNDPLRWIFGWAQNPPQCISPLCPRTKCFKGAATEHKTVV